MIIYSFIIVLTNLGLYFRIVSVVQEPKKITSFYYGFLSNAETLRPGKYSYRQGDRSFHSDILFVLIDGKG